MGTFFSMFLWRPSHHAFFLAACSAVYLISVEPLEDMLDVSLAGLSLGKTFGHRFQ